MFGCWEALGLLYAFCPRRWVLGVSEGTRLKVSGFERNTKASTLPSVLALLWGSGSRTAGRPCGEPESMFRCGQWLMQSMEQLASLKFKISVFQPIDLLTFKFTIFGFYAYTLFTNAPHIHRRPHCCDVPALRVSSRMPGPAPGLSV